MSPFGFLNAHAAVVLSTEGNDVWCSSVYLLPNGPYLLRPETPVVQVHQLVPGCRRRDGRIPFFRPRSAVV